MCHDKRIMIHGYNIYDRVVSFVGLEYNDTLLKDIQMISVLF